MKAIALMFVVLSSAAAGVYAAGGPGAAEPAEDTGPESADSGAGDIQAEDSIRERPAETELLIGEPLGDAAGEEGSAAPGAGELPGVQFGDLLRMLLVLGLVIALIYAFFWMLKRISGVKASGADTISLLATQPLKGDAALHLVETGSRLFLVGSTASAVNLVAEIDDKESMDEIRLASARTAVPPNTAGGFARRFRERFVPPDASGRDPIAYLQRRKNRLKQL